MDWIRLQDLALWISQLFCVPDVMFFQVDVKNVIAPPYANGWFLSAKKRLGAAASFMHVGIGARAKRIWRRRIFIQRAERVKDMDWDEMGGNSPAICGARAQLLDFMTRVARAAPQIKEPQWRKRAREKLNKKQLSSPAQRDFRTELRPATPQRNDVKTYAPQQLAADFKFIYGCASAIPEASAADCFS